MQRRDFSSAALAALGLAMGFAAARPALAAGQVDADADAPLVGAPKIIEALGAKDVVLDRPGAGGANRPSTRTSPRIDLQVQFTFDSADLLPRGKRQLDELAMALNDVKLKGWGFLLAGHTDRVGSPGYNLRLSLARAESVKVYLAQAHGVADARLQTIGYGDAQLLVPNQPAAAINRRVEVRRTALMLPTPARASYGGRLVPTPR